MEWPKARSRPFCESVPAGSAFLEPGLRKGCEGMTQQNSPNLLRRGKGIGEEVMRLKSNRGAFKWSHSRTLVRSAPFPDNYLPAQE